MTMKYAIIGETNGYIANRDIFFHGVTKRILNVFDTLKEANKQLLDNFNEDNGTSFRNWGLAACSKMEGVENARPTFIDGTRCYCYDSRRWYTQAIDEIEDFNNWDYEGLSWTSYERKIDEQS